MRILGIILLSIFILLLLPVLFSGLYIMLKRFFNGEPINQPRPYQRNVSEEENISDDIEDDDDEFDPENPVFKEDENYQFTIDAPDPEYASPYEFYHFLELYPKEIIDRWYQDVKHRYKFPEEYVKNIQLKVWNENYKNPIKEEAE